MPTIRVLSDQDIKTLEGIILKVRNQLGNTVRPRTAPQDFLKQSPEVYIAKTPASGILALDSSVGTGTDPDTTPSIYSAECDIYRVSQVQGTSTFELSRIVGLNRDVYNLSSTDVPGDAWVPIIRDKFGTWIATAPASSTSVDTGTGDDDTGTGTSSPSNDELVKVSAADPVSSYLIHKLQAGDYIDVDEVVGTGSTGNYLRVSWVPPDPDSTGTGADDDPDLIPLDVVSNVCITVTDTGTGDDTGTAGDGPYSIDVIGDVEGSGFTGSPIILTLDTVNSSPGAYGSATQVPVLTIDGKGRVTSSSATSIAFPTDYRPILTSARTYYVRTDGSDSNSGLVDSAGGAFLTVQKAVDVISAFDISSFSHIIQVRDGTYTGAVNLKTLVGSGSVTIVGNSGTPANVVLQRASGAVVAADRIQGNWAISNLKIQSSSGAVTCLYIFGSTVTATSIHVGTAGAGGTHFQVAGGGTLVLTGAYTISGGGGYHYFIDNARLVMGSGTVTVSGTPAFSQYFAAILTLSYLAGGLTFSGAATGTRYLVYANAVANVGGGATYFPGNAAGSTSAGGQYV